MNNLTVTTVKPEEVFKMLSTFKICDDEASGACRKSYPDTTMLMNQI